MNKSYLVILSLSILALIAVGVYVYEGRMIQTSPAVSEATASSTAQGVRVQEDTPAYTIDITYPAFPQELHGASKANEAIKNNLDLRLEQFKKEAKESFEAPTDLPASVKSTMGGSPTTEYETDRYISLYFGGNWYMRGAAHGMNTIDTYVFDKKLEKVVDITDMFTPGSGYLQFLSTYARQDLEAQSKKGDLGLTYNENMLKEGTEGTFDNFRLALPTKDGLVIYFTEYQVAPYAAGPQQVVIPYEKLKPYINPEGALADYLK